MSSKQDGEVLPKSQSTHIQTIPCSTQTLPHTWLSEHQGKPILSDMNYILIIIWSRSPAHHLWDGGWREKQQIHPWKVANQSKNVIRWTRFTVIGYITIGGSYGFKIINNRLPPVYWFNFHHSFDNFILEEWRLILSYFLSDQEGNW